MWVRLPASATGHGPGPPAGLWEQPQWLMGTDWTRQTGGFTEDLPRIRPLPRSLEMPRIWDEQRTGTVGAGPLTRTCPISPRSWEDPQGDCRKRYQLVWKRNSIVLQMEIRVLSHASVSCFGPGRASALSPLRSLSWSVSALWPRPLCSKGRYHLTPKTPKRFSFYVQDPLV